MKYNSVQKTTGRLLGVALAASALFPSAVFAEESMVPFDEYTEPVEIYADSAESVDAGDPGGQDRAAGDWAMEEDISHEAVDQDIPEGAVDNRRKSDVTLDGIDISNWQKGIDVETIQADFIICKATGGNGFKDKSFDSFAKKILNRGTLFGFYHFAGDKGYKGTPEEEAAWFYQNTMQYLGKGIPILDYEEAELLKSGTDWALRFVNAYYSLSGVRCMIYTSSYFSRSLDWSKIADAGYPLWIANYGKNPEVKGYAKKTWTDSLGTGAFDEYYMHQYSSRGRLEGYDGNLDLNKFFGSKKDWQDLCKADPVASQMHRLYNPNSGEHFYTADGNESRTLIELGWTYEGLAWNYVSSGEPVYRLYNPNAGDHHYTLSAHERDELVKTGWTYEGVGWYSDRDQGQPVYRAYNPNAQTGSHHFTVSEGEWRYLGENGWQLEGVSWYGVWISPDQNDPADKDPDDTDQPDDKKPGDKTGDKDQDSSASSQTKKSASSPLTIPVKPEAPHAAASTSSARQEESETPVFDFVRQLTRKIPASDQE